MKGAKGKKPTREVYGNDILGDRQLQSCRASTRGIWFNILCYFWGEPASEGSIFGYDYEELGRLGGATPAEVVLFIKDAQKHKFCDIQIEDVQDGPVIVRLTNRRLKSEAEQRKQWAREKRVQRGLRDVRDKSSVIPADFRPSRARSLSPSPSTILKDSNALSKDKAESKKPDPVPDQKKSRHFNEKSGEYKTDIETYAKTLSIYALRDKKSFQVYKRIQQHINKGAHPRAIVKVLISMAKNWADILNPNGYFSTALISENPKAWARESESEHDKLKVDFKQMVNLMFKEV